MRSFRIWICVFINICAVELDWTYAQTDNAMAVLNYTNIKRRLHGCPPLSFDAGLSKDCKKYARELAEAGSFQYSDPSNSKYTENICTFGLKSTALRFCVQRWYLGVRFDMLDRKAKEFTAMIWRSSLYMGYGDAMMGPSNVIMVVRYSPPGNVEGAFTENVPDIIEDEDDMKKKKKRKEYKRNSALHQDHRSTPLTILLYMLLVSYFLN